MSRILLAVLALTLSGNFALAGPTKPTTRPARRVVTHEQFEKSAVRNGMRLIWERTDPEIDTRYQLWERGGLDIEITIVGDEVTRVRTQVAE